MTDTRESNSYASSAPHLRPLVIFGAGGHAVSVANVALSAGYTIKHFVDKNKKGLDLLGYKIIGDLTELDNTNNFSFAIAVGDNAIRERIHKELVSATPNLHFPPLGKLCTSNRHPARFEKMAPLSWSRLK